MNPNRRPDIRAGTRAGTPVALSPRTSRLLFGSIEAEVPVPDSPSVAYAARLSAGAASASVRAATSVVRTGASGAEKPALVAGTASKDEIFASAAQREPDGWTAVTRALTASLRALARRYEVFAAQLHAASDRKRANEAAPQGQAIDSSNEAAKKGGMPPTPQEEYDSEEESVNRTPLSRQSTAEEVKDENDFVSSTPAVAHGHGSSRNEGKGADPSNWGDGDESAARCASELRGNSPRC
ncbi:hypothetical protein B0H14DRAFT_3737335 [Mycena olivaceomarginata]|nr:hypothetical protein B0H14DRAFT_3737335 [Mycena olivaceomarginata]